MTVVSSWKDYVVSENLFRRHLTMYAKGRVGVKIEPFWAEKAKEHERMGGGDRKSEDYKSGLINLPNPIKPIDTAFEVAKVLLMSRYTYDCGKKIIYILDNFIEDKTVEEKDRSGEIFKRRWPKPGGVLPSFYQLEYAMQFYEKYPVLCNALQTFYGRGKKK